jgi:hypothetical protein
MQAEDEEIEMIMQANEDATEVSLVFKRKSTIDLGELILAIEEFLTELTRAESDKRKPGVEVH